MPLVAALRHLEVSVRCKLLVAVLHAHEAAEARIQTSQNVPVAVLQILLFWIIIFINSNLIFLLFLQLLKMRKILFLRFQELHVLVTVFDFVEADLIVSAEFYGFFILILLFLFFFFSGFILVLLTQSLILRQQLVLLFRLAVAAILLTNVNCLHSLQLMLVRYPVMAQRSRRLQHGDDWENRKL
jgi:hypothetical protein